MRLIHTKKTLLFFGLFMLIFLFFFNFQSTVFAEPSQNATTATEQKKEENKDEYPKGITKWHEKSAYDAISWVTKGNTIKAETLLHQKQGNTIISQMEVIYKALTPIGLAFITLYFLMELIDKTTRENFNLEQLFRMLLKLVIAKFLIENGWDILDSLVAIGSGVVTSISEAATTTDSSAKTNIDVLVKTIQDNNMFENILSIVGSLIPKIINSLANLAVIVVAWSRIIELGIRCAFLPIGVADCFQDGFRGGGFRYLKKILAVALQGGVILITIQCVNFVQASILSSGSFLDVLWQPLVVSLALLMLVIKSQQMANEIIGV